MINPYEGVNWQTANHVVSLSHAHSRKKKTDGTPGIVYQSYLNYAVNGGAKHIAFSNYYPSEPFCPLTDWFDTVPEDVFCSPNAEHHNLGVNNCHINGLGCTLISGQYGGLSPTGMAYNGISTWEEAFDAILNTIIYADAGGLTINHPVWSSMNTEIVESMLDYDQERVLGIEIYNDGESSSMIRDGVNVGWAVNMWDEILSTGRRCWGLAVPDHGTERTGHWTGRNILLVNELTSYKCLKAYREGRFYSKVYDSDLAFDYITETSRTVSVKASNAQSIHFVIDGVYHDFTGTEAEIIIPSSAVYCRVEAWMPYEWTDESGNPKTVTEKIFSNPIMYFNRNRNVNRLGEDIQRLYDL